MVAVFFRMTDHYATVGLKDEKQSLQTRQYTNNCLLPVLKRFGKNDLLVGFSKIRPCEMGVEARGDGDSLRPSPRCSGALLRKK
ncbi:hypothetical protein EVAR_77822_1 [Eumeta japonica]|uniref:Uncharacterized protein n=1 Tax=Eumeta variegata TaxID=151549 RepID=A0A4C1TB28_EUMVA|nr:hypothetical protein EVAR_77822_1 [Eumeta japonica]